MTLEMVNSETNHQVEVGIDNYLNPYRPVTQPAHHA